jgi:hypothetical protein
MNNLTKQVERLEKSIPLEPKRPPAMIFVNPGETTEQKIAEFEAEHGYLDRDSVCINRFGSEEYHDN